MSTEDSYEALTVSYERLRHSQDSQILHDTVHAQLPDMSDAAAYSRATALLEAVAGNSHTPLEDRVHMAKTMPFPNVLVKLSEDCDAAVRREVAANPDSKDWLVGRLTKDEDASVRAHALRNSVTTWRMRMEGAQDERTDVETLRYLGELGRGEGSKAPVVQSAMVRRAVALNPNTDLDTVRALAEDTVPDVAQAAQARLASL